MAARPELSFISGPCKINVWKGDKGRTFQVAKSYKKKDGTYAQSSSYFLNDLVLLKFLIERVTEAYYLPFDPSGKESQQDKDMSTAVNEAMSEENIDL